MHKQTLKNLYKLNKMATTDETPQSDFSHERRKSFSLSIRDGRNDRRTNRRTLWMKGHYNLDTKRLCRKQLKIQTHISRQAHLVDM